MPSLHLAVTAILALAPCLAAPQEPDPVATVNSKPITQAMYRQTLVDWFGKEVLEEMIQAEIVAQAAERAGVVVTDAEVDKRLQVMQASMDAEARRGGTPFAAWLANRRLTIANLRARLRTELLLEKLVEGQAKIPMAEARDYYDQNIKQFQEPDRVKISVITVKTKEDALKVADLLKKNQKTWGEAVRDHNINPYTLKTDGDLGYCTNDGTAIAKAAFSLAKDGDISPPVEFQNAWHLVRRETRQSARTIPFDDVKESIANQMMEQKLFQLKMAKRDELRKQAVVQRLLDFGDPTPAHP